MNASPLDAKVTQIGLVVGDIESKVQAWAALLGCNAPSITISGPVEEAHTEYRQQPTPARAKLAFFNLGPITLELIEPIGDEPSTWHDQLATYGDSLHHIAFEGKGMSDRLSALADAGVPLVQHGDYEGGHYAYVDGTDQLGAVVELLENY